MEESMQDRRKNMGRMNKNIIKQKKKTEEPVLKQWEIANYINRQHWVAFFSMLLWGLAAHGYMFLNKFSWHVRGRRAKILYLATNHTAHQ